MFEGDRGAAAIVLPRAPLDEMYANREAIHRSTRGEVRTSSKDAAAASAGPADDLRRAVVRASGRPCDVPALGRRGIGGGADARVAIVTVNLWFDRPVFDRRFVGLAGRTMQWVFEKGSHLALVSSGGEDIVAKANDALVAIAMSEITNALPAAKRATLRRATVVREKRATFSLAPRLPPRPKTRTQCQDCSSPATGSIQACPLRFESAAMSGHWAADEFLRR
jgi:hypothetical protein